MVQTQIKSKEEQFEIYNSLSKEELIILLINANEMLDKSLSKKEKYFPTHSCDSCKSTISDSSIYIFNGISYCKKCYLIEHNKHNPYYLK